MIMFHRVVLNRLSQQVVAVVVKRSYVSAPVARLTTTTTTTTTTTCWPCYHLSGKMNSPILQLSQVVQQKSFYCSKGPGQHSSECVDRQSSSTSTSSSLYRSVGGKTHEGSSSPVPFRPLSKESKAAWQKEILVEVGENGLVQLHLNRPNALNALSMDMILTLSEYFSQLHYDQRCTAVLLTGEGPKAFCAGGDVRTIAKEGVAFTQRFFSREYLADFRTTQIEKPYLSIWNGIVMGGGCGITMHGSYRIATGTTILAMPETSIGLLPDVGASYVLPRLRPHGLGLYLGLTGARLNALDLIRSGLATDFVEANSLDNFVQKLKQVKLDTSTEEAQNTVLSLLREFRSDPKEKGVKPNLSEEVLSEICQHFSEAESLREVMDRLKTSNTEFCKKTVSEIELKCPLSCAVWFEQHRKGSNMTLADTLRMEYLLVQSFVLHNPNFKEGVRAMLVDKDGKPNWTPKTIDQVTEDLIEEMFVCPHGDPLDNFVNLSI